ncbi:MAG: hypothetical protein MUC57_05085 [Desulfobacterales bacterium]|jgi:hypothetical protein|nr:hypothetical protein [Desulfobacterales bacterium]
MNAPIPSVQPNPAAATPRSIFMFGAVLALAGLAAFIVGLLGAQPQRAWQAFLINFLLWSGMAQGAVLFAAVTHTVKARWAGSLSGLSQAFVGFFPWSLVCFLVLLIGRNHLFPWLHEDLHGKEIWLNIPFLFSRDGLGFLALYGFGWAFLSQDLKLRIRAPGSASGLRRLLTGRLPQNDAEVQRIRSRKTLWGGLYCFAFALVLSLIGFDLVMSMDPHWVSTLFGAYHFVKAFYVGLGALIILAAIVHLRQGGRPGIAAAHFHDIGKLFFAFCLLWADFFYVQLTVIWYGNIPEETSYVILRTVTPPWNALAWFVFIVCFVIPFVVLINRRVKTMPGAMIALCGLVILGIWLEHLLLIGPALNHAATELPLGVTEGLVFIGFLGLMVLAVVYTLKTFPELLPSAGEETR